MVVCHKARCGSWKTSWMSWRRAWTSRSRWNLSDWIMNRTSGWNFRISPKKNHTHTLIMMLCSTKNISFVTINYSVIYYWSLLHVCLHVCNVFVNRELRKIGGFQKSMGNSEDRHGGFRSHGGTPKNEWFISWKILLYNGWLGGTPMS